MSSQDTGKTQDKNPNADLEEQALFYHRYPRPGKLEIRATKPLANGRDLSRAYSPGVAAACDAIVEDPGEAATLTARSNLIGVVTDQPVDPALVRAAIDEAGYTVTE